LLARDDAGRIAANIAQSAGPIASLNNWPTEFCAGGPFVADGGLELLLLCGIALHVKLITFSPRLTTLRASGGRCAAPDGASSDRWAVVDPVAYRALVALVEWSERMV
jgi:hypothetical protein